VVRWLHFSRNARKPSIVQGQRLYVFVCVNCFAIVLSVSLDVDQLNQVLAILGMPDEATLARIGSQRVSNNMLLGVQSMLNLL
jgi:hypothetical protein